MKNMSLLNLTFIVGAALVLAGCGPDPTANAVAPAGAAPALQPFTPVADAGIRVEPADPTAMIEEQKSRGFAVRGNPFSLRADEIAYDRSQMVASLVEGGNWYNFVAVEPPEAGPEIFEVEPQPTRRLAGILIGESITALIDMGDGRLQPIRPGQKIEGTEWVVQSIDEEKAILRREGSEKRPKFVVVRLEDSATMRSGGGGGQGGGNNVGPGPGGTQRGRARDE